MAYYAEPDSPVGDTSPVSAPNEKVQIDLLVLEKIIAARAMNLAPHHPLFFWVSPNNLRKRSAPLRLRNLPVVGNQSFPDDCRRDVGDIFCRRNEVRADFRAARDIRLQIPGRGARPQMQGRRNGLGRGVSHRARPGSRFTDRATLSEDQFRPNTLLTRGGFPADKT